MEVQIYFFDPESSVSPYAFAFHVYFMRNFSKSFLKLIQ